MKKFLIFIALIAFLACSNNQKEKTNNKKVPNQLNDPKSTIPADAIPFQLYRDHIYLRAFIDGQELNILFDTGAKGLYMDKDYYQNSILTYKNLGEAMVPGVGNKPQKIKFIQDSVELKLGNLNYQTKQVPLISLRNIVGDICDGIIGNQFFKDKILEINFQEKYLRTHKKIDSLQLEKYTRIAYQEVKGKINIPLKLHIEKDISIEGYAVLDIGSGGNLTLGSPVAKKYNLDKRIAKKVLLTSKYSGIGGVSNSYCFIANSISLGGYKLTEVYMNYSLDEKGSLASADRIGLLGTEVLKRFNLLIDYKNQAIYLKANSNIDDVFQISKAGFTYVDRTKDYNAWIVTGLYKNSPAEKAGVKIDDKITHVNGKSVKEINRSEHSCYFNKINTIQLTILRNDQQLNISFKPSPLLY